LSSGATGKSHPRSSSDGDDPIELVVTVRVELPDELVGLLRQVAIPSAAPPRANANKTWTEARGEDRGAPYALRG